MSWTGCLGPKVKVISAAEYETFLKSGVAFTPTNNGVFLPDARYQRYRRLIADRLQEESK